MIEPVNLKLLILKRLDLKSRLLILIKKKLVKKLTNSNKFLFLKDYDSSHLFKIFLFNSVPRYSFLSDLSFISFDFDLIAK